MTFTRSLLLLLALGSCHAQEQTPAAPPAPLAAIRLQNHPFLDDTQLPAWSKMTPEQAQIDCTIALQRHAAIIQAIENAAEPTYENTFGLYTGNHELFQAWLRWLILVKLHDTPETRTATEKLEPLYLQASSAAFHSEKLWNTLKKVAGSDEVRTLSPARQRLIAETVNLFREEGADLPPEKKTRLAAIDQELSRLSRCFTANIIDSTKTFELSIGEENAPEATQQPAPHTGTPRRILNYGNARPTLAVTKDEQLRKTIWQALQTIATGTYDNEPLIKQILTLRRERAQLLGYPTYADMVAARTMLGTGAAAKRHICGMIDKLRSQYAAETETLRRLKADETNNPDARLEPWDQAYYIARHYEKQSKISYWALASHFPADNVLQGMFGIYSQLYGITVIECPAKAAKPGRKQTVLPGTVEVWHRHVRFFEIHDQATGKLLGSLYIDAGNRPDKRPGIWTQEIRLGSSRTPGIVCISLAHEWDDDLDHASIEQLFHEFGHALHRILYDGEETDLGCISIARDFNEFPSIINELWTWDRDILQRLCQGPLPDDAYEQILANRNLFRIGNEIFQYKMALLDLELHSRHIDDATPLDDLVKTIMEQNNVPHAELDLANLRENMHLFSNSAYAGLYFVYLWDKMLAEDAFSRFREKGLTNPETGAEFRRTILSKGNSKPAIELYRNFMGRAPKPDVLLQTLGIQPTTPHTQSAHQEP